MLPLFFHFLAFLHFRQNFFFLFFENMFWGYKMYNDNARNRFIIISMWNSKKELEGVFAIELPPLLATNCEILCSPVWFLWDLWTFHVESSSSLTFATSCLCLLLCILRTYEDLVDIRTDFPFHLPNSQTRHQRLREILANKLNEFITRSEGVDGE